MQIKHLKQIQAFKDPARFKFLLVGRRGGKTYLMVEDMCKRIAKAPPHSEIFYIGPTLQQAYELIWEPLEQRFDQLGWKYGSLISKRRFEFQQGKRLYIIGAEKIRRIRGHKVFWVYLDEVAFFEQDLGAIWRAVRPALTDMKGGAVVATTPNGKGTQAYDFYMEALTKHDWKTFSWVTAENPFIDKKELENAKLELDEKSYKQEYEAQWQSFEGLAFYNFDESVHIKRTPDIEVDKPLILCFDFNVNPTTLLLQQNEVRGDLEICQFKAEYSFKNSSTIDTVRCFCEDYKEYADKLRLKIRGDSSGKARTSVTGRSDYYYIEQMLTEFGFNYQYEVPAKNPPIVDRVQHVNSYLKNVKGQSRIEVDPCCKELIRDLSSQTLEGRLPSDKNNLGHKADAFGYSIYWEYINKSIKPQGTIQL